MARKTYERSSQEATQAPLPGFATGEVLPSAPTAADYTHPHDAVWDNLDGSRIDDYYFPEPDDPLNELIKDVPVEYSDKDDPFFRYAGVFIDSAITLKLLDIYTGKYGLFQRLGHVAAGDYGYPHVSEKGVQRSLEVSQQLTRKAEAILRPILSAQGVPKNEQLEKIDAIREAFRERYSGSQQKRDELVADREYHVENANSTLRANGANESARQLRFE